MHEKVQGRVPTGVVLGTALRDTVVLGFQVTPRGSGIRVVSEVLQFPHLAKAGSPFDCGQGKRGASQFVVDFRTKSKSPKRTNRGCRT